MIKYKHMDKIKLSKASVGIISGFILLLLAVIIFGFINRNSGGETPWFYLMTSVAAIIIILLIAYLVLLKKGKIQQKEPDYYTFFIMGIVWLVIGIPTENSVLWIIGLVFTLTGLANKNKWKKQPKLRELPPAQKNLRIALFVVLVLMFLAGLVAYYVTR